MEGEEAAAAAGNVATDEEEAKLAEKRRREASLAEFVAEIRKTMTCSECGKLFASVYNMRNHVEEVHNSEPQKCPICSKQLKNIRSLWGHIHNMHNKKEGVDVENSIILIQDAGNHTVTTDKENGRDGDAAGVDCSDELTPDTEPLIATPPPRKRKKQRRQRERKPKVATLPHVL